MGISFKALTSQAEIAALEAYWKTHQWNPNADWDFYHTIIKTRKEVVCPCVLVAYDGTEIVALVAGRIEATSMSFGFGYAKLANLSVRQLVLINGGFIGQWDPALYRTFMSFLRKFIEEHQLDLVRISQVRLHAPFHALLIEGPRRQRAIPEGGEALHWLMRLPATWPEFLQSRSKKHRYWIKRLSNILDRDFPGAWSMQLHTSPEQSREFLQAAEKIADTTYHRGLGVGIRADEQNLQRLKLEAERGQLRGYLLTIKEKPCAFWYCSVYGKTLHLCTTGYDSSLRDYELGTVLLMKVFQDHCGSAIEVVDFGLGDAGYKQRFGTENYKESSFCLFASTRRGGMLRTAFAMSAGSNAAARRLLDRLRLTQSLKTFWRQRLAGRKAATVEGSATTANGQQQKGDES